MSNSNEILQDAPGFVRDGKTGVVINTNTDGYDMILAKRRHDAQIDHLQEKMEKQEQLLLELTKALGK